ncbi:MAG TPA: VWA domain-containing protein [Mycobacteriales bacterium]|jgi:hypothetical protein
MDGDARFGAVAAAGRHRGRRSGELTHDVAVFTELLREIGVPVPASAVITAVGALDHLRLDRRDDVETALRCCLTAGEEDGRLFDAVFQVYWSARAADAFSLLETSGGTGEAPSAGAPQTGGSPAAAVGRGEAGEAAATTRQATYSRTGRGDGRVAVLPGSQRQLEDLARRMARALGAVGGRRTRTGEHGERVDVRDSLRHNLRFGGELVLLRRTRRVEERARLAVLCDVSSSMQPYTPLFLAFVHALTRRVRSLEAAVFDVECSFVTDVFRRHPLAPALDWLRQHSVTLAGGTRIGHCLRDFTNGLEVRGAVRANTTVLVLSDGWDVGEPELLEAEMRRLRSSARRVIWLDPYAAAAGYTPEVGGLRRALPFVDDYLDFSSLRSLGELVSRLESRA